MENGRRLLGYYLFVSNSSDWTTGEICYQHEGPRIPSTFQNITCSVTGRYVTLYNFRNQTHVGWGYESEAYLELCEVEVYGCPKGFYGLTCDLVCSENCISSICNPDSAECALGCIDGWAGSYCNIF
ncbi:hypothetical protein KUTeg_015845 [Tegillarca granosa]|uniref:Scavenger receptor class F member 2 n=1 Tax=Tegillarca granosa TaxID=220873 RepID=A0ABQ9EJC8_TEGGR|nr:hypothetical protein KUTeg_015845 [Tegillarca granosa]